MQVALSFTVSHDLMASAGVEALSSVLAPLPSVV